MGFDHGAKSIVPANWLMIVLIAAVWAPVIPLWILLPLALVAMFVTTDKYGGMVIGLIIEIPVLALSLKVLPDLREAKDAGVLGGELYTSIGMVIGGGVLAVAVIFGGTWFYLWLTVPRVGKRIRLTYGPLKGKRLRITSHDEDGQVFGIMDDAGATHYYPVVFVTDEPTMYTSFMAELSPGQAVTSRARAGTILAVSPETYTVQVRWEDASEQWVFVQRINLVTSGDAQP